MNIKIHLKRIGNHWYPNILHNKLMDISLDTKLERLFNKIDMINMDIINIAIVQADSIKSVKNLIQFKETDVIRYLTTSDDFEINVYVNNHNFKISSQLYYLLESQFNFNFHTNLYKIEIW